MKRGFTLIELLVVVIIVGVTLSIIILSTKKHIEKMRLKRTTQDLISDLQFVQEEAKAMGTQSVYVIFGKQGITYTGTYTVKRGDGSKVINPLWQEQTEEKRNGMQDFGLKPGTDTIEFATRTAFAGIETIITLYKNGTRTIRVSPLGQVKEVK
ncbi:MAG: prepilin-type N-terminal cleavage/methylation domain-containing protein [Candidatus Desantisbacteria bacterium]|mgnify:FL=1